MVSIAGAEFITQENILELAHQSYFMKTYGKMWLARPGFTISGAAFHLAMWRTVTVAAVMLVLCLSPEVAAFGHALGTFQGPDGRRPRDFT